MSKSSSLTPWTPAQPDRRQGERRNPIAHAMSTLLHRGHTEHRGMKPDRRTALQHYGEQAELAEALIKARRWDWVEPILSGEESAVSDKRTHIIGLGLMQNKTIAEIIDQQLAAGSEKK